MKRDYVCKKIILKKYANYINKTKHTIKRIYNISNISVKTSRLTVSKPSLVVVSNFDEFVQVVQEPVRLQQAVLDEGASDALC